MFTLGQNHCSTSPEYAARAREARKLIVGELNPNMARRVIVAGYGDSQPISGIPPEDARQRRIEVRFVLPNIH